MLFCKEHILRNIISNIINEKKRKIEFKIFLTFLNELSTVKMKIPISSALK